MVPAYMRWSPLSNTSWLSFLNSTMCAKTYSSTCFASCALFGSLFATPRMSALSLDQNQISNFQLQRSLESTNQRLNITFFVNPQRKRIISVTYSSQMIIFMMVIGIHLMKYSRSSSPHLLVIWASRDFSLEKASSRSNSSNWGEKQTIIMWGSLFEAKLRRVMWVNAFQGIFLTTFQNCESV